MNFKIICKIIKKHLHFTETCGNILEHLISSVSLPMGLMPFNDTKAGSPLLLR